MGRSCRNNDKLGAVVVGDAVDSDVDTNPWSSFVALE